MTKTPYHGSMADVERLADALREAVQQPSSKLLGRKLVTKIIELTGGSTEIIEDPCIQEAKGGSLIIRGESDYTVYLSPYTTPFRDNFTIGHELGHFFLHYFLRKPRPELPLKFTRYGTGLMEWQANRFGAALLMPADVFKEMHEKFQGDSYLLSGYFETSIDVVIIRGQSLNYFDENIC